MPYVNFLVRFLTKYVVNKYLVLTTIFVFYLFIFFFIGYLGITLSYFGRQLIAREVELEIMRRSAPKAEKAKKSEPSKKIVEKKKKEETSPQGLPNHLQTLKPKIRRGANVKETVSIPASFISACA